MLRFLKKLFPRRKKAAPRPFCSAVVVAAGASTRMGEDKLFLALRGEPVLVHTLRALECSPVLDEIIVVARADALLRVSDLCRTYGLSKVKKVLTGGDTRTASVRLGTLEVSDRAELIAIHDGARPLVSSAIIEQVVARAAQCNAAAPAIPVKDTLKRAANGLVIETPDRAGLFAVQTPQVFDADLIRTALQKAIDDGAQLTDDCAAVERIGFTVALTEGHEANLKITTPADLAAAEGLLAMQEEY